MQKTVLAFTLIAQSFFTVASNSELCMPANRKSRLQIAREQNCAETLRPNGPEQTSPHMPQSRALRGELEEAILLPELERPASPIQTTQSQHNLLGLKYPELQRITWQQPTNQPKNGAPGSKVTTEQRNVPPTTILQMEKHRVPLPTKKVLRGKLEKIGVPLEVQEALVTNLGGEPTIEQIYKLVAKNEALLTKNGLSKKYVIYTVLETTPRGREKIKQMEEIIKKRTPNITSSADIG